MSEVTKEQLLEALKDIHVGKQVSQGIDSLILKAIKESKEGLTAKQVAIAIFEEAKLEPKELIKQVLKWLKSSTADNKLEKKYKIKFEWIHDADGERTFKFKG